MAKRTMTTETVDAPPVKSPTGAPKREEYPIPKGDAKFSLELDATAFTYPDDYDAKKYRPFKIEHFKSKSDFYVYKAIQSEMLAIKYREDAKDWRENGEVREVAKKAETVMKKVAELRTQLAALGMDEAKIEEMLAAAANGGA